MVNGLVTGVDLWQTHMWSYTGDPFPASQAATEHTYGYAHLPSTAGETNRVTAQLVQALPGVIHADVRVPVGAAMDDMSTSTLAGIGFAAVAAVNEEDCWRTLEEVASAVLRCHTDAVGEACA